MRFSQNSFLFLMLLLIGFSCDPDVPDFELGRYEYMGFDKQPTYRFFRIESGNSFREVTPKKTGIGKVNEITLCHEDLLLEAFYACGAYPKAEKPYFEFRENEVEFRLLESLGSSDPFVKSQLTYKIEGDSIVIGTDEPLKFAKPQNPKTAALELPWRLFFSPKVNIPFNLDIVKKNQTEQELLREYVKKENGYSSTKEVLTVGDTIMLCLFKERFVKQ